MTTKIKDPWNVNEPFQPMFNETVRVFGSRPNGIAFNTSVEVCVFTDDTDQPISDEVMDCVVERILICFKEQDWQFMNNIRRGDTIERVAKNGKTYKVTGSDYDFMLGHVVRARTSRK